MKKTRFAIAQMNPVVGDYAGNYKKIIEWIESAEKEGADIIVFPECALNGYPVWDLANKKKFVSEGLVYLEKIIQKSQNVGLTIVIGFIDSGSENGRSYNAMAWISRGKIIHRQYKRLLPTYDVFLEEVFFQPGETSELVTWRDMKIGLTICEDIWDEDYDTKPLEDLAGQGADFVINISASPYFEGVAGVRDQLLKNQTKKHGFPILYVNQIGGQDDLIFDGRSLFADAHGNIVFRAPAFTEGVFFFDWDPAMLSQNVPFSEERNLLENTYAALRLGIKDYCQKNGFQRTIVGVSGGIDSALVAVLAVDALGSENVKGVAMPGTYSAESSLSDARDLVERLGIEFSVQPIQKKYENFLQESGVQSSGGAVTVAMENLQARLRGMTLMFISNEENRLVLTTGNKSELAVGYCTLYGDMAGGLAVIGDVYKTDVYRLAEYCNREKEIIPRAILAKAPSAELRPNQTDQDSLPPYETLDSILRLYIEGNKSSNEIISALSANVSPQIVADIVRRVDHNEYKRRQTPPILRVTEKAWFGRRMPITNHFDG